LREAEGFVFVEHDGRWMACLMGCNDQRFCFTPVEVERAAHGCDQTTNLGVAGFLDSKPALLKTTIDLSAEPAQLSPSDPVADNHVVIDVLEQSDCLDPAECHESGRIADKRHERD
jgi:hypothetical protein